MIMFAIFLTDKTYLLDKNIYVVNFFSVLIEFLINSLMTVQFA